MKKIIISLEGLPASGKTTLLTALSKKGIEIIPEIMDSVPNTGKVKRFTLDDISSTVTNRWFLNIEYDRLSRAFRHQATVALDRCFVSQIAYNYAKDLSYKTQNCVILKQLMKEYAMALPNIIYLRISTEQSIQRMLVRNKNFQKKYIENDEPDYRYNFLEKNRVYYEKLIPILGNNILAMNGDGDVQKQVNMILDWAFEKETVIYDFDIENLFLNI